MDKFLEKRGRTATFVFALVMAALVFLPYVIYDKGYFFYYGDFNVQQIPFYQLVHECIRTGDIGWNWYTDLGANFIGSYSFYNLFSPFFWLTIPFPTSFLPHLMAPLLVLKTACAALTSYIYLRRYVSSNYYACIGGLLYAFSGWAVYNIFFNHFHEPMIFFPLMLYALDELILNKRKGLFAVTVAINAVVNYWFFIGAAVFAILYFFFRATASDTRLSLGKIGTALFEGILGVALSAFALLPSVMALMGNPRTGLDELLTGWNFLSYYQSQRYLGIIHAMFLPPDMPALPNFFNEHGAQWASLAAYLPLFGMAGVLAYLFTRKKDWLKKMLLLCFFLAMVPGLNSIFILFNHSYYARWFYMPLLLMSLATVTVLEAPEAHNLRRGVRWQAIVTFVIISAVAFIPVKGDNGSLTFGIYKSAERFWVSASVALVALLLLVILTEWYIEHPKFKSMLAGGLALFCILYSITLMGEGRFTFSETDWIADVGLAGRDELEMDDSVFARTDIFEGRDNLGMFWHLPNIQAFHSVVPASIMEFYPKVGVKRDVSSKPETRFYALRSLLSVRWLFVGENQKPENQPPMSGYSLRSTQLGYHLYENDNFLPMGFSYDYYIDTASLESVQTDDRSFLLMRGLYLEDEAAILRNSDILTPLPYDQFEAFDYDHYTADVAARRTMTSDSFTRDKKGFTATTNFITGRLVFFSVPYEKGWSATVNGQPAIVEKANIGFMAVRVPPGAATIRFHYETPGLTYGIILTAAALLVLGAYLLFARHPFGGARKKEKIYIPPIPPSPKRNQTPAPDDRPTMAPPEKAPPEQPPPNGGENRESMGIRWQKFAELLDEEEDK